MCFSAQASFYIWVITTVISAYVSNQPLHVMQWFGTFGISVAAIQLLEGFVWLGYGNIVKYLVLPVLWSQCLVNSIYIYLINKYLGFIQFIYAWLLLDAIITGKYTLLH